MSAPVRRGAEPDDYTGALSAVSIESSQPGRLRGTCHARSQAPAARAASFLLHVAD
jgi:hypothetical protein